jgi:hypothetical protein
MHWHAAWPERAVYFLREALRYSRRDTALLLGMSDANIDQLYLFGQKRVRYSSNPSFAPLPDALALPPEVRSGSLHGNRVLGGPQK